MFKKLLLLLAFPLFLSGCKEQSVNNKDVFDDNSNVRIVSYDYKEPEYAYADVLDYRTENSSTTSYMKSGDVLIPITSNHTDYVILYKDLNGNYQESYVNKQIYMEAIDTKKIEYLSKKSLLSVNVLILDEGLEKGNVYTITFKEGMKFYENVFKQYVGKDIVYKDINKILKQKK